MIQEHDSLVRAAARGDARALDRLFDRHLPGLLAYVRVRATPRQRARDSSLDLVQSACREVLQDIPERDFVDETGFRRWLYVAAERKILDRAKHHGREMRDAEREQSLPSEISAAEEACLSRAYENLSSPSRKVMLKEEIAAVEAALEEMPEDYREVIVQAYLVGLSHAEIAQQLGRSEGAVRVLLHRALTRLSLLMGPR